jgi:hypothetical protein
MRDEENTYCAGKLGGDSNMESRVAPRMNASETGIKGPMALGMKRARYQSDFMSSLIL